MLTPYFHNSIGTLYHSDALEVLRALPDESVQCCVTSPPYWGLRDYQVNGQLGLESSPEEYINKLVIIFDEVARALKKDGLLFLNLGDSYVSREGKRKIGDSVGLKQCGNQGSCSVASRGVDDVSPKNLLGMPWRVALALQARGWYLRADIIWHKTNPMPESVTDRPTKAHEYIFMLSKSAKYYYDHEAVKEPVAGDPASPRNRWDTKNYIVPGQKPQKRTTRSNTPNQTEFRNLRSVWSVATNPYPEAHFATFPPKLIKPCILAGSRPGDVVLDPFLGSGTTGHVARKFGRKWLGIELNRDYCDMALRRIGVNRPYLWECANA